MTTPHHGRLEALRTGSMRKLWVLMFTAFVDMVGVLMIIPLLPFYAKRFGASGLEIGVIVAMFSVAQLLSAPLWGRVSDRYGRKPALLIGLGASVIAYIVFAFSNSVWMLLLSRAIQGAGGGTTGVIQAYVADAVEPRNRAKGLGWLSAATNVGVMLGPAVGSAATYLGSAGPGLIAATLCLLNIGFAYRFLGETHGADARARSRGKSGSPLQALIRVTRHAGDVPSRLIWTYAISIGFYYGTNPIISLFLMQRYGITTHTIGWFFVYMGALNVFFRVTVLGRVVDRIGEVRSIRVGLFTLALGLATIPLTYHFPLLALAIALLPLGATLTFPAVTGLLSQVVGDHERGVYMGVQQTYGGILRVIGPLVAGKVWDVFGVVPPFALSATVVVSTIGLGIGLERYVRRTGEHPVPAPEIATPEQAEQRVAGE
ncbi:MAG TPA: MFS transporter [Gemmatimonadaceae bacterium]